MAYSGEALVPRCPVMPMTLAALAAWPGEAWCDRPLGGGLVSRCPVELMTLSSSVVATPIVVVAERRG